MPGKVGLLVESLFGRVGELERAENGALIASLDDLMAAKLKVMLERVEAEDYAVLMLSGFMDRLFDERRGEETCGRGAQVDANRIAVETHGGEVSPRSRVSLWSERDETQLTVWSTPGITKVNTGITVGTI